MKRRGLIRWNFFFYLALMAFLVGIYAFTGISGHVKSILEQRLSELNGAPVKIGYASFSWKDLDITLENIEFQDADDPSRTVLTIARMHMNLDTQAFLRNRFVVKSGGAYGFELHPLIFSSATAVSKPETSSIAAASDFLQNPDRAQLPDEAVWKAVPSVQATTALQSEIDNQVGVWQKRLVALANDAQTQNQDLQQNKENETHAKIVQAQIEKSRVELDNLEAQVKAEGNVLLEKIGTLAELVPHDVTVVRQAVKIPNLEFKDLGHELGSRMSAPLLDLAENFQGRLIPWLLAKEQVLLPRFGRRQGTDFHFEGKYLPPRLWIQDFELISHASPSPQYGEAIGRIQDLSSEPHHYPASLSLQASFEKAEVSNVQLEVHLDHKDKIDDKLQLTVAKFPIRDLDFARTPTLRLGIEQAAATLNLEYVASREASIVNVKSQMTKVSYRNETQSETLRKVFDSALGLVTTIDLEASAQGKPNAGLAGPEMHWTYVSNLSDQMRVELQKTLGQEFAEYNARIHERAEQKAVEARQALETKLVTESDAIQQKIASSKALLNGAR